MAAPHHASGSSSASLRLHHIARLADLPDWVDGPEGLTRFLHESLKPYEDTPEDIRRGLDDAVARSDRLAGFILLAELGERLVGSLVIVPTGMRGYVPANILLFVAVSPQARGRGIGGALVKEAIRQTGGDVKLHVEYDNPAKRLYERLGFRTDYAEMRYRGGEVS